MQDVPSQIEAVLEPQRQPGEISGGYNAGQWAHCGGKIRRRLFVFC